MSYSRHPVLGAQHQKAVAFPFQYTANTLPTMAIQTTLTAEGTLTLKASICQASGAKSDPYSTS